MFLGIAVFTKGKHNFGLLSEVSTRRLSVWELSGAALSAQRVAQRIALSGALALPWHSALQPSPVLHSRLVALSNCSSACCIWGFLYSVFGILAV